MHIEHIVDEDEIGVSNSVSTEKLKETLAQIESTPIGAALLAHFESYNDIFREKVS